MKNGNKKKVIGLLYCFIVVAVVYYLAKILNCSEINVTD